MTRGQIRDKRMAPTRTDGAPPRYGNSYYKEQSAREEKNSLQIEIGPVLLKREEKKKKKELRVCVGGRR